ncbi:MAG: DUF3883 domain-containing protein [Vicinamibacterales bacterium]
MPPQPWSVPEVEATVAAYFEMLRLELAGIPYQKSDFNSRLRTVLDNRSKAAVEYKFQNISAVLINQGQGYIRGYLPAQNYQRMLETAVLEWLEGADQLVDVIDTSPVLNPPDAAASPAFSALVSSPPERARAAREPQFKAGRIDFVRRDAENRALGQRGEEFAFDLERQRLHDEAGRPDLARRVRWVARDEGDGLGYDISSFAASGEARLIEVKTTGLGKYFPFALTRNELDCSRRERERYQLYRFFDFGRSTGLYVLDGALDDVCILTPTMFRASAGKA